MAAEVLWLDQAKDDLRAILDYIAAENAPAADRYVAELYAACSRLALFPMSARPYNDEFGVLVFRNHLVSTSMMKPPGSSPSSWFSTASAT